MGSREEKIRLDLLLVNRGLSASRERARALILSGAVLVDEKPADKAGALVSCAASVRIKGKDHPYVSRGGLKLKGALDAFQIDVRDLVALDVGASTGGFTDCLLQEGARRVYALDVGYGQLAWKLRTDPRVICIERTNIRYFDGTGMDVPVDLVTIDASFISLKLVIPAALKFLGEGGLLLALIKPQFEVGKGQVGKGGVVREPALRQNVLNDLTAFLRDMGLEVLGSIVSPLPGSQGKQGIFCLCPAAGRKTFISRSAGVFSCKSGNRSGQGAVVKTMSVFLAKTAGFCMGVKRAVDTVLDIARHKGSEKIYTYGPLIHNPQTVEFLRERGIIPIKDIEALSASDQNAAIVIRAHGISPSERKKIRNKGLRIIDATCPKVTHVQAIIRQHAAKDYNILIIGDGDHPEVNGLLGHAGGHGRVIGSLQNVEELPIMEKVCVVAQTTQNVEEYAAIVRRIRDRFPETVVFNTICDSTEQRQAEVRELAARMEAMVIVGGRNSANTRRLAALSSQQGTPTFHIETADELNDAKLAPYDRIGLSAGASTPNWIIDRVVDRIAEQQRKKKNKGKGLLKLWTLSVRDRSLFRPWGGLSVPDRHASGTGPGEYPFPSDHRPICPCDAYLQQVFEPKDVQHRFLPRRILPEAREFLSFRSACLHAALSWSCPESWDADLSSAFFHIGVGHSLQSAHLSRKMEISQLKGSARIKKHLHGHGVGHCCCHPARHGAGVVCFAGNCHRLSFHHGHRVYPFLSFGYSGYSARQADWQGNDSRAHRQRTNTGSPDNTVHFYFFSTDSGCVREMDSIAFTGPSGQLILCMDLF